MPYSLRRARADDADFLWAMLYEASHAAEYGMPDVAALRAQPEQARYVEGWGSRTDLGVIAVDDDAREPVGAAWLRLLTREAKGYGYVDDDTPELAIAVVPGHRGRGLGGRMLGELLEAATRSFVAVSLSVRADNPARRLYERAGFRIAVESETGEPAAGGSVTMKFELRGLTTGSGAGRSPRLRRRRTRRPGRG
jgi:ribosomal protein S18 acetylase RimI-like enzyme